MSAVSRWSHYPSSADGEHCPPMREGIVRIRGVEAINSVSLRVMSVVAQSSHEMRLFQNGREFARRGGEATKTDEANL